MVPFFGSVPSLKYSRIAFAVQSELAAREQCYTKGANKHGYTMTKNEAHPCGVLSQDDRVGESFRHFMCARRDPGQ